MKRGFLNKIPVDKGKEKHKSRNARTVVLDALSSVPKDLAEDALPMPNSVSSNRLSQLPKDLVDAIFGGLDLDDLMRVSCVCRSWNLLSLSLLPVGNSKLWLIVPLGEDSSEKTDSIWDKTLGFFSLSNGKIYRVEIPQIVNRRVCGSCPGGWLITVHENGEIQLLHPFSKVVYDLPPLTKLPGIVDSFLYKKKLVYLVPNVECSKENGKQKMDSELVRELYIGKVVMSSSKSPSMSIVMCIQECRKKLAFCRLGKDEKWDSVGGDDNRRFDDVIFYQGQFYAVQGTGHVFVVEDLDSCSPFVKPVISPPYKFGSEKYYLVECNGELLLVMRFLYEHQEDPSYWESDDFDIDAVESYMTTRFEVFKLDFDLSRWVKVFNLGKDHALFVGDNQSFSLGTSDVPGCKGNCIYFTDDYAEQNSCDYPVGGFDIGVFDMRSGSTKKCYPTDARVIRPPPVWFTTHQCNLA